jgi:hypothetical protein
MQQNGTGEPSASQKRALTQVTGSADSQPPGAKSLHLTASKIHGIAPKRKPRIGPDYQAVVPPLEGSASEAPAVSECDK